MTVAPLSADLAIDDRPLAIVIVADPEVQTVSERDLADFFGLSPAEGRLAAALMAGKKLDEVVVV